MNDEEKKSSGGNPLIAVALALLVLGGGGTYYFYNQYQTSQRELAQAREASVENQQAVVDELVNQVGSLIELPEGDTPTVATIRTTDNLADHPFLSKGLEGDRLLIYTGDSRMVVMYRPSTNKIVAVGTVTIQQAEEGEEGDVAGAEDEGAGELQDLNVEGDEGAAEQTEEAAEETPADQ